jgi:glycosyltransferase involved in cell wall biosynthesis
VSDKLEDLCVLIPAYVPEASLPQTVAAVLGRPFRAVVVVNDGSPACCEALFDTLRAMPRVHVLAHAENLGKGASLKTGLGFIAGALPGCAGVVTADADGQHSPRQPVIAAGRGISGGAVAEGHPDRIARHPEPALRQVAGDSGLGL